MSLSDELLSLSSVEMRRRIGTKEISPVELVEASIARIEALNPAVNAIAATDFAHARKLAWGATGNPFDPRLNAGRSSGGSAVALACDMLPVCTGSDTGGSLRIPAAICGVVGFRPSPGVVPMDGRPLGWTPISVLGPMGRSVADLRLLFSAQIGMDDREPLAFPLDPAAIATARPIDLGRLRVAFTEDFGQCPVSAEIRRIFRSRIASMRQLFRSCDAVKF